MPSPAILFISSIFTRDWRFLAVTIISCIVAATVANFQFSVYRSFRAASAVVPQMVDADLWLAARSVECFDFPTPFSADYAAALAGYFPEARLRLIVVGFAPWRSPLGRRSSVNVVGIEGEGISDAGFVANRSDAARLDLAQTGFAPAASPAASIADVTLYHEGSNDRMSSFLGTPYVLISFDTARHLLRYEPTATAFIAINFRGPAPPGLRAMIRDFQARNPEVSLMTKSEFEASSMDYWQSRTGAGLAIGLAAILALLLLVLLLTHGVTGFIQRYHADLLSLLGHGAGRAEVTRIVTGVGGAIALVTLIGTAIATPLLVAAFKPLLPWTSFAAADLVAPLCGVTLGLIAALAASRQALLGYGPEVVFRS